MQYFPLKQVHPIYSAFSKLCNPIYPQGNLGVNESIILVPPPGYSWLFFFVVVAFLRTNNFIFSEERLLVWRKMCILKTVKINSGNYSSLCYTGKQHWRKTTAIFSSLTIYKLTSNKKNGKEKCLQMLQETVMI